MDPVPIREPSSVPDKDKDKNPNTASQLHLQAVEDIARLAVTRDHEKLKMALESQVGRLAEVVEAALLLLYKDTDNRKQSMECLINNATNWFFDQFSATGLLVSRWEHLPLTIIAIMVFALDIALDTRPVLERALAVSATAAHDDGAIDSLNKSLLIPLLIDPILQSQAMYGFITASGPVETTESSNDLPSDVQTLLNKHDSYAAIALAAYLASPVLLPCLDYEPYRRYDRQDTIERLARQCSAKYNGAGIADHLPLELQMALKKVIEIACGDVKVSRVTLDRDRIQRTCDLVALLDKVDPSLVLSKPE